MAAVIGADSQWNVGPEVQNVLLFLHAHAAAKAIPSKAGPGFEVVVLDYAEVAVDNYISLRLSGV